MEIILLEDVVKLGYKHDTVTVRPGYANNFLIPKGMAIIANAGNKKMVAENLKQAAFKLNKLKQAAEYLSSQLGAVSLTIPMLVGKEGRIYGSVTNLQIANLLKEKGFDIDRKKITIPEDIRTLGEYSAKVHLHKEVDAEVKFTVMEKPNE